MYYEFELYLINRIKEYADLLENNKGKIDYLTYLNVYDELIEVLVNYRINRK